jgi:hypothetical protein
MRLHRNERPFFACMAFFLFLVVIASDASAGGQDSLLIKRDLVWSRPECEVDSPRFSDDGNFIVLATRVHWPDAAEAEGLPDSFFVKLTERKRKNPRFADPVIRLIDLKGNQVCEVRYGSHPSISPDHKRIVFSRQKKSISGLRLLAQTLAGNDIQVFDCEKKESTTIAEPDRGYLDNPIFLPDGNSIAYTMNEAVNGAYGGPVGIERVDLAGAKKEILVAKDAVPSVRSQGSKQSSGFAALLFGFAMTHDQLVVLQGKHPHSAEGMDLPGQYVISIKSVFPERNDILSLGQFIRVPEDLSLQSASDGRLMVYWQYWRPLSLRTKKWLPDIGPRNTNEESIYSPDLKYYLVREPDDSPDHFTLYQTAKGERLHTFPKVQGVYDATWSQDSKRLAFVVVPMAAFASNYHEDLMVYSVP